MFLILLTKNKQSTIIYLNLKQNAYDYDYD